MNIERKIKEILNQKFSRFSTPGHKGTLFSNDISEIRNGKYFPADLIKKAQEKASDIFKCKHTRFLTHGASLGIKASILAVNGDIIVPYNSHRSVLEGATLAKKKCFSTCRGVHCTSANKLSDKQIEYAMLAPTTFPTSYVKHYSMATLDDVSYALEKYPQAKAVVLTTPDYFGRTLSLDVIKAVKDAGKILILDSAHGTHFSFRPDLFPQAYMEYADLGKVLG